MTTMALLASFLLIMVILIALIKLISRPTNLPKISGIPFLGLLLHLKSQNYQKTLIDVLKTKGRCCRVQLGSYECLWLNDYKVIREAWGNLDCCGRPKLQGIVDRTTGFSGGIIFNEGEDFLEQRRFTVTHLKDLGLGKQSMENIIVTEVDAIVETLIKNNGEPLSTRHLFNIAALNILWVIISGSRFHHNDKELNELVETITRNMELQGGAILGLFIPWLTSTFPRLIGWTAYLSDANKVFQFWRKFTQRRIKSYDAQHHEGHEPTCFVDMYIKHIKDCKSQSSSFFGDKGELSLAATLQDLFIAGTETTATTLSWIMLYLAVFQNYQQQIYDEILASIGDRNPILLDRRKMSITEAFISETMRHATLAPLGMIHSATRDVELCGIKIPKGTLLHANLCAAHHDPSQWELPEYFCPERFLSDENKYVHRDSFLPFSTGKRRCPGETLARNELFLFLVGIVQKFLVTITWNEIEGCLQPKLGVSASPKPHNLQFLQR